MIIFSGYGFLVILINYFGGLILCSKLSPYFFKTYKQQYLILLLFHVVITCINFSLAKYLNRKEIKHTLYEIRIENIVFIMGLILLVLIIMMGKNIIY